MSSKEKDNSVLSTHYIRNSMGHRLRAQSHSEEPAPPGNPKRRQSTAPAFRTSIYSSILASAQPARARVVLVFQWHFCASRRVSEKSHPQTTRSPRGACMAENMPLVPGNNPSHAYIHALLSVPATDHDMILQISP